jgi:hypothetical protein
MINEKLFEVLKYEGVVAIVTQGDKEPHIVNTWNSYVKITEDNRILIPAGYMNETEANVEKNNEVQITLGSKEVQGFHGPGTGFLIRGTAAFIKDGRDFEVIKEKFPWARALLEVKVSSTDQKI